MGGGLFKNVEDLEEKINKLNHIIHSTLFCSKVGVKMNFDAPSKNILSKIFFSRSIRVSIVRLP